MGFIHVVMIDHAWGWCRLRGSGTLSSRNVRDFEFSRQVTIAHGTRVTVDPLPALTLPRTSLESLEAATQMLISSLNLAATVDFCHAVLTRPMAGVGLSR